MSISMYCLLYSKGDDCLLVYSSFFIKSHTGKIQSRRGNTPPGNLFENIIRIDISIKNNYNGIVT